MKARRTSDTTPTRAACVLAALALVFAAPLLGQGGTICGTVRSAGGDALSLPTATLLDWTSPSRVCGS